jgi:hypothetical protein
MAEKPASPVMGATGLLPPGFVLTAVDRLLVSSSDFMPSPILSPKPRSVASVAPDRLRSAKHQASMPGVAKDWTSETDQEIT